MTLATALTLLAAGAALIGGVVEDSQHARAARRIYGREATTAARSGIRRQA